MVNQNRQNQVGKEKMIERKQVIRWYQDAVVNAKCSGDLKQALRTHERVPAFINNLHTELNIANLSRTKKGKPPFKVKTIIETVRDMVAVFIQGIESQGRTQADKLLIQTYQKKEKDLEEASEGKFSIDNHFKEIVEQGVQIGETKETKEG